MKVFGICDKKGKLVKAAGLYFDKPSAMEQLEDEDEVVCKFELCPAEKKAKKTEEEF